MLEVILLVLVSLMWFAVRWTVSAILVLTSKYARVLTSDSGELPKLSTKSNCVVCWSFR